MQIPFTLFRKKIERHFSRITWYYWRLSGITRNFFYSRFVWFIFSFFFEIVLALDSLPMNFRFPKAIWNRLVCGLWIVYLYANRKLPQLQQVFRGSLIREKKAQHWSFFDYFFFSLVYNALWYVILIYRLKSLILSLAFSVRGLCVRVCMWHAVADWDSVMRASNSLYTLPHMLPFDTRATTKGKQTCTCLLHSEMKDAAHFIFFFFD